MAQSLSSRLERLSTIVGGGFWIGGLAFLWATVRPSPRPLAATLVGSYFLGWGTALVLSAPPRSRMIARFSLTTLALTLCLGCLELLSAVGVADFRTVFRAKGLAPGLLSDNRPDPELGHIHKPYLKRTGATRGDIASALHLTDTPLHPYDVSYDRRGFRNPRELTEAGIVVLGDSFVEGGLVASDDLLTATLARLLDGTVANLGQSGYGPQQELVVLKRYALSLRPGLCVWIFYEGNDLDDVVRYGRGSPHDGRVPRSTPLDRSFGLNALRSLSDKLGDVLDPDARSRAPGGTFRDANGRATYLLFRDRGALTRHEEASALDDVISILSEARAACAANRSELLVVYAPQKFRVYKEYCTFAPDNPCTRWVLDDLPERLGARVAAIGPGIAYLDLTPSLADEAGRGRLVYLADDTHWSAEGHRAAGRAIADAVVRRVALGFKPVPSPGGKPTPALEDAQSRLR